MPFGGEPNVNANLRRLQVHQASDSNSCYGSKSEVHNDHGGIRDFTSFHKCSNSDDYISGSASTNLVREIDEALGRVDEGGIPLGWPDLLHEFDYRIDLYLFSCHDDQILGIALIVLDILHDDISR